MTSLRVTAVSLSARAVLHAVYTTELPSAASSLTLPPGPAAPLHPRVSPSRLLCPAVTLVPRSVTALASSLEPAGPGESAPGPRATVAAVRGARGPLSKWVVCCVVTNAWVAPAP